MAHPFPPGLTPEETAFLCEMESVTVIPRQRLESLQLLGGPTTALRPPQRADLPLWLALLLKRQRRASISPPPWLQTEALQEILERETSTAFKEKFTKPTPLLALRNPAHAVEHNHRSVASQPIATSTPPFLESSTVQCFAHTLPYHYLELSMLLLTHCPDDIPEVESVQRLVRDLREVRQSKLRTVVSRLDGGAGVQLDGIGAMELGESRAFLVGVVDGLRRLGASRETGEREIAEDRDQDGRVGGGSFGYNDEDEMEL